MPLGFEQLIIESENVIGCMNLEFWSLHSQLKFLENEPWSVANP